MSETTILGFSVSAEVIRKAMGGGSKEIVDRIALNQKEALEECGNRFECGYSEDRELLKPKEALEAVIGGNVSDGHLYECACVLEPMFRELGEELDDNTENLSLWNNLDFWLEDFIPIFEHLGLRTLAKNWMSFSFPLNDRGITPDWPVVCLMDESTLIDCREDFSPLDLDRSIKELPGQLFENKDEYADEDVMKDNIVCLQNWISQCHDTGNLLILVFDGDQ